MSTYPDENDQIDLDKIDGEIWERHPEETDKQFKAFSIFRDLGPDRNKVEAYCKYSGKDRQDFSGNSAPSNWYEWAKVNKWNERVAAWDNYQDQKKQEEYEEEMEDYYDDVIEYAQNSSRHLLEAMDARFKGKDPNEKAKLVFGQDSMNLEGLARCYTQLNNIIDKAFGNFVENEDNDSGDTDFLAEIKKVDD